MRYLTQVLAARPMLAHQASTSIHGNSISLHIWCPTQASCPALCQGGLLVLGDVSVPLSCEHAKNLADRAREAIDATVLGSLPPACGCRLQ